MTPWAIEAIGVVHFSIGVSGGKGTQRNDTIITDLQYNFCVT